MKSTNKIECVIFDFDGTIVDSEKIWKDTSYVINKKYGMTMDEKFRLSCCGRGKEETIAEMHKLWPQVDVRAARDEWENLVHYEIDHNGISLKKGFKILYNFLKKQNIKLAIATGSCRAEVIHYMEKANLDATAMFDYLFTIDDVKKGKPNPEIFKLALKTMGVKATNCLAIEDSPTGACAAWRAGIKVLLIPDVFKPTKEAKQNCIILDDLNQAKRYIEDLCQDK